MKKIFFTIIFIVLIMLLVILTKNHKEYFSDDNIIKDYNVVLTLKKNDTMAKIINYFKNISNENGNSDNFRIQEILTSNNYFGKISSFDNLLNVIILSFIIEGNNNNYITKQNLKKIINIYFDKNIIIKNNINYDIGNTKQDEISVQVPINILETIKWTDYEQIFDYLKTKNNDTRLYLKDVLEIKKNILVQHFINQQIPLIRIIDVKDKQIQNYKKNYLKLLNKTHQTNYTSYSKDDNYFNFRYNFTINYLIEIYKNLQIKKKDNKIFFNKIYSKSLSDNNIPLSLIMGNLYMPSIKSFNLIINRVQNKIDEKIKMLPNNWSKNYTNYLSDIEYYPYRFQYPLNLNCQRVWQNCSSKDRINEYYKYYRIPKNNNPSVKTYNMSDISFE